MAIIRFEYNDNSLKAITYSTDPVVGNDVIALGSPEGQQNAISFGKVQKYDTIKANVEEYLSNVSFNVIMHDAYINSGSSGGALLDSSLKLIGINFAGTESSGEGYAIPISKVFEFCERYFYKVNNNDK